MALPAHQHRFFAALIPLWQAIPGRVNARNFSRYSGWNERTLRRWFQKTLPWAELHWGLLQLLVRLGVLEGRFILALDASFVPKSGKHTPGLGAFWNGALHRSETGLELSCLALLSWSGHHAFLSMCNKLSHVDKRPTASNSTWISWSLSSSSAATWLARHLRVVVADGQYAKTMFMDAVSREGYAFVTKMQCNANLLYPFTGAHPSGGEAGRSGPGKSISSTSMGGPVCLVRTGNGCGRASCGRYTRGSPGRGHPERGPTRQGEGARGALQHRPTLPAEQIRALYSARFRLEFVFRDAKQFAGLNTCQLRRTIALENHWNAAFFALSLGRAEVLLEEAGRLQRPASRMVFSYEDIKRGPTTGSLPAEFFAISVLRRDSTSWRNIRPGRSTSASK
ncbi:transposase, partial [Deinococcus wulumuqiensis]|uniref:transposase n=1 Tax=Deinococcus wulumuqiensis TaxID=980427 RepID=UPI00178CB980